MKTWKIISATLLALIPFSFAQSPIDVVTGDVQEQINAMGQQLQGRAVQHIVEGNLTTEHISQDLNATKQNLTRQAKEKINQEIDEKLNLTSEQIQQKAAEELKRQTNRQVPGFEALFALFGLLSTTIILAAGRKR